MNKSVKLLSLNISIFHKNNEAISQLLKETNPDIVCFQEVTRKVDESALDTYISKNAVDRVMPELSYSFFAPNWALRDFRQKNFHGEENFEHDFGGFIEYGNYIKSRYKIIQGKSIFVQGEFSYLTDWESFSKHPGKEPRTAQIADLEIENSKNLRIINYHGIWTKDKKGTEQTKSACEKLDTLASEVSYPTVICGDFNLFPHTESIEVLDENFVNLVNKYNITRTRPITNELSAEKRNVVDYIFVSHNLEVKNFEVIDCDVSDHFPLFAEFVY
ncbi:MAG: endonuclease/exonuclease/phosphatase family protein [Candidatus Roizmanbacteria bacterium]|nr:MAG: endonuclease/exonuclease/phosphatase family protein [Candidatus Roizmanbacteria bacterium]